MNINGDHKTRKSNKVNTQKQRIKIWSIAYDSGGIDKADAALKAFDFHFLTQENQSAGSGDATGHQMVEWVKNDKESRPPFVEGGKVVVALANGYVPYITRYIGNNVFLDKNGEEIYPSHWMLFPKRPEIKECCEELRQPVSKL